MGLQPVSLKNNDGLRPLIVGVISITFATAAVILRFYSHKITKTSYARDDIMILVALVRKFPTRQGSSTLLIMY